MPIHEADPWRLQYFTHVKTDVDITTEDSDAWQWYPAHRWVYDKLAIAQSQGIEAGPHGTKPPRFPIFSKPIVNLKRMGIGSRVLRSQADYEAHAAPGHFWMRLLEGRHVSSDLAVVDGEPRWWRHVTGKPAGGGTFDYWTIHAEPEPEIEARCGAWVRKHLAGYTGMLNLETIGGTIIEVHLRFADQWPDLYGPGWVDAVVRLYETGIWDFADSDRRGGYSVVLFWAQRCALLPSTFDLHRSHQARAGHLQCTGHLPRGYRAGAACDAAWRFSPRCSQWLRSRSRTFGAGASERSFPDTAIRSAGIAGMMRRSTPCRWIVPSTAVIVAARRTAGNDQGRLGP